MHALIESVSDQFQSENQRQFFRRVWANGIDHYRSRLQALGFQELNNVLDAGSGFGQWSFALAELNENVSGLELDLDRVEACKKIAEAIECKNIHFLTGSVEIAPFQDGVFDGLFSYSVIYLTDYKKTLLEFYRLLKPGGLLYFSTNGIGWYLYNLIETHNDSSDYSSRKMAADTIKNSIDYYATGKGSIGSSTIMNSDIVSDELKAIGFDILEIGPEGSINCDAHNVPPFYPAMNYGYENVWEVLCRKRV